MRSFHGYDTQRFTYNAYLILDEKITLIDTVKRGFDDELSRAHLHGIDPLVSITSSQPRRPDHSHTPFPSSRETAPNAKVITAKRAERAEGAQGVLRRPPRDSQGGFYALHRQAHPAVGRPMLHWPA